MTASLAEQAAARAEAGTPIRVALIGAGRFGAMFLSQARRLRGVHVVAVADLAPERARVSLRQAGWPEAAFDAATVEEASLGGGTCVTDSPEEALAAGRVDVVVEATGAPGAGAAHALQAFEIGCHVVMANAEADALVGPVLARRAARAGVVYSLAYGDQPALICELVDWARACGLDVVCAGKGTKYLPGYRFSTPETVWPHYGLDERTAAEGGLNPRMFNSFLDGTKSAIEMACVANATGLAPQAEGLRFPPCGSDRLAQVLRPASAGGVLSRAGTVEVVSSLERDGQPVPNDLRWGVFVTFEAPNDFVRRCFTEYGLATDDSGRFSALYRPYHLIGLEVSLSVLRAALRGEATGSVRDFRADVVATAKRDLAAGEVLDGEGGRTAYGTLVAAGESVQGQALPIGLADGARLRRPVARGTALTAGDVDLACDEALLALRRELEQLAPGV
jgi:predicted homoserine dehydrogenase-like protein